MIGEGENNFLLNENCLWVVITYIIASFTVGNLNDFASSWRPQGGGVPKKVRRRRTEGVEKLFKKKPT